MTWATEIPIRWSLVKLIIPCHNDFIDESWNSLDVESSMSFTDYRAVLNDQRW